MSKRQKPRRSLLIQSPEWANRNRGNDDQVRGLSEMLIPNTPPPEDESDREGRDESKGAHSTRPEEPESEEFSDDADVRIPESSPMKGSSSRGGGNVAAMTGGEDEVEATSDRQMGYGHRFKAVMTSLKADFEETRTVFRALGFSDSESDTERIAGGVVSREEEHKEFDPIPEASQTAMVLKDDSVTNDYLAALAKGFHFLLKAIYHQEVVVAKRPALQKLTYEEFVRLHLPTLATFPACFLREILHNNLAHAHLGQRKRDVCAMVRLYNDPWVLTNVAVVYMIFLVDDQGLGPTADEWEEILKRADAYRDYKTRDRDKLRTAYIIDRLDHKQHVLARNQAGWRRYLAPYYDPNKVKPPKDAPASVRYADSDPPSRKLNRMQEFMDVVKQRIQNASRRSEPITLNYVGFSYKPLSRWEKHDKQTSSEMMGLSAAIARTAFPHRNFRLAKYVVCPVAEEHECGPTEVLGAAFGNSYFQHGYGFNVAGAGESNDSYQKFTLQQKINSWKWILQHSPRKANLAEQLELLKQQVRDADTISQDGRKSLEAAKKNIEGVQNEMQTLDQAELGLKVHEAQLNLKRRKMDIEKEKIDIAKLKAEAELLNEERARIRRVTNILNGVS